MNLKAASAKSKQVFGYAVPFGARKSMRRRMILGLLLILVASGVAVFLAPWWLAVVGCVLSLYGFLMHSYRRNSKLLVNSFFSERRHLGTAGRLVGRVGYGLVFVQANEAGKLDESPTRASLKRALDFLVDEASRYGHDLTFVEVSTGSQLLTMEKPESTKEWHLEEGETHRLCDRVAELPFWSDVLELDACFGVVVTPWGGYRAFAIAFSSRFPVLDDEREMCVCPATSPPSTFAHEILHLFGARDLYIEGTEPSKQRDQAVEVIKERLTMDFSFDDLSDSIMDSYLPGRVHVDPATAYSVGWLEELPLE